MAVLKKIRSRKGASITFALLAFLVCAVVSSVVLAAASASAGRASDLAAMDQRYYAVSSAAQLFRDTLDGQEFTIERSNKVPSYAYTTYQKLSTGGAAAIGSEDAEGNTTGTVYKTGDLLTLQDQVQSISMRMTKKQPDGSRITEVYLNDVNNSGDTDTSETEITNAVARSFLAEVAASCVFGGPKSVAAAYAPEVFGESVDTAEKNMSITVDEQPDLAVDVAYTVRKDGTITFKFSKGSAGEAFSMELVLVASVRDNSASPTVETEENVMVRAIDAGVAGKEGVFTERIETVKTSTKTTIIKWTVADVRKVVK